MTRHRLNDAAFGLAVVAFLVGIVAVLARNSIVAGGCALVATVLLAVGWWTTPDDVTSTADTGVSPSNTDRSLNEEEPQP